MSEGAPLPAREPLSPEELRARRAHARARRTQRRHWVAFAIALVTALAVGAGVWASLGAGGSPPARRGDHVGTVAAPTGHRAPDRTVTFTVEASGDLLIHSPVWDRALVLGGGSHYNFAPLFAQIKPFIERADLPLCHVETPLTPAPPTGYPTFNSPPELAVAIRQTGWRVCSTAATHTLDRGQSGVDDTIHALDQAGVLHTGSFASAAAQRTPLIVEVKGIKVAFLAYTDITNGIPSPHPWSVNRATAPQILADAHRAVMDGARAVIVNIHWGDEYISQPNSFQMGLAETLTRSPYVTAIVGQHVHVVQPIRRLNGKVVVFGEGNLISNQTAACCVAASQDGMIVFLTVAVNDHGARVTFVHYLPIWVRHPDFVVLPAGYAIRTDSADAAALRASYARTVAVVGRSPHLRTMPSQLP